MDLHAGKAGLVRHPGGMGEAARQVGHFLRRHRARVCEGALGQRQRHRRGRHRPVADAARRLAAWMVDLHPELRAVGRAGARIGPKRLEPVIAVDHHVARPFEVATVNLHVARDDEPGATRGPASIEPHMPFGGTVHGIGQPLGERRLADAVLQHDAIGQGERLGEMEGAGSCHGSHFAKPPPRLLGNAPHDPPPV